MTEQPRLIFVGNVIVDIVMAVDAIPAPGGDTIAHESVLAAGGGYNVMIAAVRDGMPVVFGGRYGSGPFGDIVRSALAATPIRVVSPGPEEIDSGYCVVLVDARAERTFVTAVGAEARLNRPDLDRVTVAPDDTVFVSGYSLAHPQTAAALPGWLADLPGSVRVITDLSPLVGGLPEQVLTAVLARTDVLTVNRREALIASGIARRGGSATVQEVESVAELLLPRVRDGGILLVRDSEAGAWVTDGESSLPRFVPAIRVDAVDSTGAGDTHGGVLAAALSRGDDPVTATRRANAAAALTVTQRGPGAAPTAAEIDALLASSPADGVVARR